MSDNFIEIAEPYKRQIGNVTYIISAFGNAKAKHTADEMIMRMLENKILNGEEGLSNGNGKRVVAGEAHIALRLLFFTKLRFAGDPFAVVRSYAEGTPTRRAGTRQLSAATLLSPKG